MFDRLVAMPNGTFLDPRYVSVLDRVSAVGTPPDTHANVSPDWT